MDLQRALHHRSKRCETSHLSHTNTVEQCCQLPHAQRFKNGQCAKLFK